MTYVIAEPCVDIKDKACLDVCPVDCIYEGKRSLYIHPDECIDCHACEPACPVEAIFPLDELPEKWSPYAEANRDFFTEVTDLGSPGGAANTQAQDVDHPVVVNLATRA
ncbi:ferredoxin [Streptomyces odontomachi]|uniref:ferredoxin n=1 Tax=Streptomyces odontomachi TaxID=2944940 RepID=UPI00210CC3C6|nr:ferredoxin [Streptomyces sp. ODS25]